MAIETSQIITQKIISKILEIRHLTESTYVIRFQRNNLAFRSGQYVVINPQGYKQRREYSIYSSMNSDFLELIIKEVDDGLLSRKLKHTRPGDLLEVEGPFGYFVLDENTLFERKFLFLATGTGISPFHSIVNSYPGIDYLLLHGVRHSNEGYERENYKPGRYIQCTSQDKQGDFQGRVTDYLKQHPAGKETHVYLCGNSAMIDEAYSILESQQITSYQIHTEVYF